MAIVPDSTLLHLLIALAAVLALGQTLGRLFAVLGQPPVIGEVVAGIVLGPSVLGRFAPDLAHAILPPQITPLLQQVAQLGAVLYMFLVGTALDVLAFRGRARAAIGIAQAGIAAPFVLAIGLAWLVYPFGAGDGINFSSYALFLGVLVSITAFPVLARILEDGGLQRSDLGRLALSCAAIADVTAWCLLAVAIGAAQTGLTGAVGTVALTLLFVAAMIVVARPCLVRLAHPAGGTVTRTAFAAVLLALLVSAAITEALGVHALFGAFMLGAMIPADSPLARALHQRLDDVVALVLLPAFFAVTGLRTEIRLLAGAEAWLAFAAIVVVGSVGKIGGTALAARAAGLAWRPALGLGVLMNTRGLMQLIALTMGLSLGIVTDVFFTVMALAALAATVATAPALHALGLWPMRSGESVGPGKPVSPREGIW